MNLQAIRDLVQLITAEKGVKFEYTQEDYDDLLHLAQMKHYKRKLGLPEEYSPGMPLPTQAFEVTQRITEDLRRFKVTMGWKKSTPIKTDSNGHLAYPSDYYMISVLSWNIVRGSKVYERNIKVLSDLEYQSKVGSVVKKPTVFFPVANLQSDHIRISPEKKTNINMVYLRTPKRPVTVIIDSDDFLEIDIDNSVDLEWDYLNIIDIISILLGDMGIAINSQNVAQYAQNNKERGI